MPFKGLSIIIPTKDRGKVFDKTLKAVYAATNTILSEIIVINDSKTKELVIGRSYTDRVNFINNPKSGVASARNLGAQMSKYPYLLFLDDDIFIFEDTLVKLISLINQYPNSVINFNWTYPDELIKKIERTQFGRYLISHGFTSLKGWIRNAKWNDLELFEVDLIASYFLYIHKETFNKIGGYNEHFPHAGAEDYEFAKRLKQSSISCLCSPLDTVYHNEEDRVSLIPWLQRKERSAETRKVAVDLGNEEMAILTTGFKKRISKLIHTNKGFLFFILKIIPNIKIFDFIYFKIVNRLFSVYLYNGYFK
jgi:glycosyltransferase involved in cell wall biosynthesis